MTTTPERAVIDGYELLARIGEGGMGIVHLARRTDGSGDRVALKVLRPHVVGDQEARERLAREVRALRRVDSPRVAAIIDADPFGETPYVVTRYVPGYALGQHVEEEGLVAGRDLLHLALGLAEALSAVHAVGVLHRDVKPSNVLMEGRSPVLIDFGLARAAEDSRLTVTGYMLGTPGYLPPEVLYGDQATAAGDVYAWAATVAFAATGRPPFGTGHPMGVLDRARRGEHDLDGVSEPLAGLLAACLAVEPERRPTVPEVIARIRGWQQPGAARPAAAPVTQPLTEPVTQSVTQPWNRLDRAPEEKPPADDPPTRVLTQQVADERAPVARVGLAEKALRGLQRLALGLVVVAATALAPYLTAAVLALVVVLARTVSVGHERHRWRQVRRGGARKWFDGPATALSSPGYLLLASGGAVALLAFAGLLASGAASAATLADKSATQALLLAGVVLAPALWWGPGSARVRGVLDPLLRANARRPGAALVVAAVAGLLAGIFLAVVALQGPYWWPAAGEPWQ